MKVIFFKDGMEIGQEQQSLFKPGVAASVTRILADVRRNGDAAVVKYAKRFDGVTLSPEKLRIAPEIIAASAARADKAYVRSLRKAVRNIRAFHRRQAQKGFSYSPGKGIRLGQIVRPLERVGLYVPGGRAAYPSSLLMNAIPAQIAGVKELVMVTPPKMLLENPAVCAAISEIGIDTVLGVGGAQAVAALAYGTRTIPRVDKIVGPGNEYVQCAKQLVYGTVDIDMIAGPSEVLIIADGSADPAFIAADLIAQAEHEGNNPVYCVVTARSLVTEILDALREQMAQSPRKKMVRSSLNRFGSLIVTKSIAQAVAISNAVAPEHLQIMTKKPREVLQDITNAGSIFVGPWSPVPLGDFYAGTNHVLPTATTARFFSPLGVYDFIKTSGVTEYTKTALAAHGSDVARLADAEGLDGHARAVRIRTGEDEG